MTGEQRYERLPSLEEWLLENIDFDISAGDRWAIAHVARQKLARLSALEHVAALADELRLYEPRRAGDATARARLFAALDALAAVDAQETKT